MTALIVRRCEWRMVAGQKDLIAQKLTIEPKGGLWAHASADKGDAHDTTP